MERMRIACPSCAAEYNVPERLLAGAPRMLRCSRCGTEFPLPVVEPAPPPPEPAPEPVPERAPEPEPEPVPPAHEPEPQPGSPALVVPERTPVAVEDGGASPALLRAWAASLLALAAGVVALVLFRGGLMEAWPPSVRLFAALGLA